MLRLSESSYQPVLTLDSRVGKVQIWNVTGAGAEDITAMSLALQYRLMLILRPEGVAALLRGALACVTILIDTVQRCNATHASEKTNPANCRSILPFRDDAVLG